MKEKFNLILNLDYEEIIYYDFLIWIYKCN